MVSSDTHLANVVRGKTARACDNCTRKRARWYCAADDAFLCQSCDGLVHAANPLARRHERLLLKTASLKLSSLDKPAPPTWHQGFTKKPRTPRGGNHHKHASCKTTNFDESIISISSNPLHLVPEIGSDETSSVTRDEKVLYQVPVFDPFGNSNETVKQPEVKTDDLGLKLTFDLNNMSGLMLPSDVKLADFAADVENLLGKDLDEETFGMEELGLMDCRVKVEEDQMQYHEVMEMMRDTFQLSFDYESSLWEEKDEKVAVEGRGCGGGGGGGGGDYRGPVKEDEDGDDNVDEVIIGRYDDGENDEKKSRIILKLVDFEGIIGAWDERRSPWTSGDRPEFDPDDCWPQCMGGCEITHHYNNPYGDSGMMTGNPTMLDGGREARVSRYREKRRTRLFSKKIRYEVRKLNAEKRPRMKGRFVKRSSCSGFPLLSK